MQLLIDRRNDRAVAAINDVREPVAVVLNERLVAIGERPFGSDQDDRDKQLRQSHEQAEKNRPARVDLWFHRFGRDGHDQRLHAADRMRILRITCVRRLSSHYSAKQDAGFHFRALFDAASEGLFAEKLWLLSFHPQLQATPHPAGECPSSRHRKNNQKQSIDTQSSS